MSNLYCSTQSGEVFTILSNNTESKTMDVYPCDEQFDAESMNTHSISYSQVVQISSDLEALKRFSKSKIIYLISNIQYDEGHADLPDTLAMSVQSVLGGEEVIEKASEFISEQTGFCHTSFSVDLFELREGQAYTCSGNKNEYVFMGQCDISDQYRFATKDDPTAISLSLEGHELHRINAIKSSEESDELSQVETNNQVLACMRDTFINKLDELKNKHEPLSYTDELKAIICRALAMKDSNVVGCLNILAKVTTRLAITAPNDLLPLHEYSYQGSVELYDLLDDIRSDYRLLEFDIKEKRDCC